MIGAPGDGFGGLADAAGVDSASGFVRRASKVTDLQPAPVPLGGFFFARVHERFGVVGIQALSGIVECVCVDSGVPSN